MKIHNYSNFIVDKSNEPINENLDKSKKFLKQRHILHSAANSLGFIDDDMAYKMKEGDIKTLKLSDFTPEQQQELSKQLRETRLSDDEVRRIERDPEFVKLRELLEQNIGYLYIFVYMYYVEKTPFNEIEALYNEVLLNKPLLDMFTSLPEVKKAFNADFIDVNIPNAREHRTNAEILAEGLEALKDYRKVKRILETLTPKLKKAYKDAPELDKKDMTEIAIAFDELSDEPTKEKDQNGRFITKKERIWKNFFGEMKVDNDVAFLDGKPNPNYGKLVYKSRLKRFESMTNPIRELVRAAKSHINASLSDGYTERLEKIDKCNDKFGVMGCEVVLHEGGVMIVQVNSHVANQFLNSHSNHCIVNYASYWNSYLGEYNKQYYLYNFNLSPMDDLSTIGVTIDPKRGYQNGACQSMRNNSIGHRFKDILRGWEKEYKIGTDLFMALEPMTNEEIEKRKRAKIAEREIVKKGISIEKITQYVKEDGADINKDNAKALINAVEENDIEKTKFCLSLGASPNLAKGSDAPIAKANNIEMIKLLVSYGSDVTGEVFNNILHDKDSLEYCLKAGLDPNFNSSMPFRRVSKGTWKNRSEIGESFLEAFKLLLKYGGKIADERDRNMIIKWASEYGRTDMLDHLVDEGYGDKFNPEDWIEAAVWLRHARKMDDKNRDITIAYLEEQGNKQKERHASMPKKIRPKF